MALFGFPQILVEPPEEPLNKSELFYFYIQ